VSAAIRSTEILLAWVIRFILVVFRQPAPAIGARDSQLMRGGWECGHRDSLVRSRESTLGAGVVDDAEATALSPTRLRLDDDLDILPEPGQETHQPFAREVCQSAT
jgi:hypothetical protein